MASTAGKARDANASNGTGNGQDPGAGAEDSGTITLSELLEASVRAHEAGQLETAEQAYKTILDAVPDNADALHFLGVLRFQKNSFGEALGLIEKAIEHRPGDAQQHNNLGKVLEGLDRLGEAEEHFRKAVAFDSNYAEAHANLGFILLKTDRDPEALTCFEVASNLNPNLPLVNKAMGELHLKQRNYDSAEVYLKVYLKLVPGDAQAISNLGYAVQQKGDFKQAEQLFLDAIEIAADSPELRHNLRNALAQKGHGKKARELFRQLLREKPEMWVVEASFALNLAKRGLMDQAKESFNDIVDIVTGDAAVCHDIAVFLVKLDQFEDAIEMFQRAIEIDPNLAEAYIGIGAAYISMGEPALAEAPLRKALAIKPDAVEANINMCRVLREMHDFDQALIFANIAFELPDYTPKFAASLMMIYQGLCDFEGLEKLGDIVDTVMRQGTEILPGMFLGLLVQGKNRETVHNIRDLIRHWAKGIESQAAASVALPPRRKRGGDEKLRIGFQSSDFCSHSVAKFLLSLLTQYDRERFEFYCYTPIRKIGDPMQHQFQESVDQFTFVEGLSSQDIAALIRQDEVEILFDLNGFTRWGNIGVLAYKPAPVQMVWLGYPFTCGLESIDYVVMDRFVKPTDEDSLIEEPLVMPEGWVCYNDLLGDTIAPGLPMDRNGVVTFGTLNNPYKYTPKVISLWAEVMNRVPDSRFLVVRPEAKSLNLCRNVTEEFAKHGVDADRLFFLNNKAGDQSHLSYYNDIDITLDTFPLTGGTTTCEAILMGVPVVTLVGDYFHQRISYSDLMQCGLEELCTFSPEEYVDCAVKLAGEHDKLLAWRHGLRDVMKASPLCDGERFVHQFQEMLEQIAKHKGLR